MPRLALALALATAATAVTACGGSSGTPSPDPRRFNALSQQVASAAASYGTQTSGMASAAACNADESTYDGQVRPMVTELQGMGPAMDDRMSAMSRGSDADMDCAASAMMAELDRHRATACASTGDMGPDRAEAQQHVAAMTRWADHELARSAEMGDMMGSGMGGMGGAGATTGHCVRNADGTYTLQP